VGAAETVEKWFRHAEVDVDCFGSRPLRDDLSVGPLSDPLALFPNNASLRQAFETGRCRVRTKEFLHFSIGARSTVGIGPDGAISDSKALLGDARSDAGASMTINDKPGNRTAARSRTHGR
jgi:hypothetical protein